MTTFGERVKRLRKALGLKQADVAKRTHGVIGRTDLSRIENGLLFPSVDKLPLLANALEEHIENLFYDEFEDPVVIGRE